MAEIDIKQDADTGVATMTIKDPPDGETRFRLRDVASGKYLSKRGWGKTANFLPGDAEIVEGHAILTLEPDVARKIPAFAALEIEAPAAAFVQPIIWTGGKDAPPAVTETVDDENETRDENLTAIGLVPLSPSADAEDNASSVKAENNDDAASTTQTDETPVVAPVSSADALMPGKDDAPSPEPESVDKQEERVAEKPEAENIFRPADRPRLAGDRPDDAQPSRWRPTAIAAGLFLLLGTGLGYALFAGDGGAAASSTGANSAVIAQGKIDEIQSRADQVAKERDEARDELAATRKALDELKAQASAGDTAPPPDEDIEKANAALLERSNQLRDAQAKISVLTVQLEALQKVAADAASAKLERQQLADKVTQLTADLNAAKNAAPAEDDTGVAQALAPSAREKQLEAEVADLKEERDLFQTQLNKLNESMTALKADKQKLESQVASVNAPQAGDGAQSTPEAPIAAAATGIWGAASIDQAGVIYSVQNRQDESEAKHAAASKCSSQSRFRCEPLLTFSNACFSVARFQGEAPAGDNFAYYVHENKRVAIRTALRHCRGLGALCDTRFTACSPDASAQAAAE